MVQSYQGHSEQRIQNWSSRLYYVYLYGCNVAYLKPLSCGIWEQAVAGYGISSRLLQFPEFILMGLCEGVVPLIAFSFTANKLRMKHTIAFTIKTMVALAVAFLVGAIMLYVLRNKLQPELDSLVQ